MATVDTEIELGLTLEELFAEKSQLIVYNDDVNTFDHVIDCLVKYCKHVETQAEQCALLIHMKGKCSVKNGTPEELKPICEALLENHITAKIEEC